MPLKFIKWSSIITNLLWFWSTIQSTFTFFPTFVLSRAFHIASSLSIDKFISIWLILLQMLVKLFLSNRKSIYFTIWIIICSAKYVWKHFEVVCFHIASLIITAIACIAWWQGTEMFEIFAYCSLLQSYILQTRTESLRPCIVSGVQWSVKSVLYKLKCKNHTFACIDGQHLLY